MSKKKRKVRAEIIKTTAQIKKSDSPSHLEEKEDSGYSDWLEPDYTLKGLENMTRHSSILPQCIKRMLQTRKSLKMNLTDFQILWNFLHWTVIQKKFLRRLLPPVKLMELHIWR